jgi:sugar lactone lactonase YvrE
MLRIDIVTDTRDLLGESPLWDDRSGSLLWIDSRRRLVHRMQLASGARQQWPMPHEIGSIALCESGRLLVALERDVHFLDLGSGELTALAAVTHPAERMRLNDGRTDRAGRYCVGSLVLGRREPHGVLYQLQADGAVRELDRGVCVSNSTCFSPDGRWLYFSDSVAHQVWRYAYDTATGAVGPRQSFIDTQALNSAPDGAAVDADGGLWVALVLSGQLARFTSEGALDRLIDLGIPYASCPCIGGEALDTIYVTSISDSGNMLRTDHPDAGALLAIHGTGVRGLPEVRFADLGTSRLTGAIDEQAI